MRAICLLVMSLLLPLVALPATAVSPGENGGVIALIGDPAQPFLASVEAIEPATGDRRQLVAPNIIESVAVSPDGTTVAYTLQRSLYLQPIDGTEDDRERLVDLDAATRALEWSPDGEEILVVDSETFTAHPVDGGEPRVLAANEQSAGGLTYDSVTWTSQDQIVALELSELLIIDGATGESRRVDPAESPDAQDRRGIDSSPDGSQLVFTCARESQGTFRLQLCISDLDMVVQRTVDLSDHDEEPFQPAFSPDGTHVAFLSPPSSDDATLHVTPIDGPGTVDLGRVGGQDLAHEWAVAEGTAGTPPPPPPSPGPDAPLACGGFDGDGATTERADITDPVAYAVAVSQARFGCDGGPSTADHVALSRDDAFADSLVGAALTGSGPLLFTATDSLPAATEAEIGRVVGDGGRVYLLGGTAAISQAVEDQLADSYDVVRLAGPSRVETSIAVAREVRDVGGDRDTVAVARADSAASNPTAAWADSVTAGAWTAAQAIPTVVTGTAGVHPAVAAFLADVEPGRTVLLGGEAALSGAVESGVPNPERIAGGSRAGTARAIADQLIGRPDDGGREAVVINGYRADGWLFGLPAAGLAADTDAPIAIMDQTLPPETADLLCGPATIDVLLAGSEAVITPDMAQQIEEAPACGA